MAAPVVAALPSPSVATADAANHQDRVDDPNRSA
jgi:hypothetical protein